MQEKFKNKKYLLIDEFSMLGQFEFFWLDSRLKQIMSNDDIFGGLSVILCGDIFQLPPVKSHPLYDKQYKRFEEQFGFFLYREFNQIFILDKIMRQQGNESDIFVSLLENLRIGNPCVNDWVYLKNNSIYHEDLTLLPTTIRLFATNNDAKLYNLQQISNSSDKLFCSISNDSNPNIKNKNTELFGGLGTCLYLLLNSPYYLTSNLNVKLGLANGTMGMLRDVLFNNVKGKFHPHILIMEFKNINNRTTANPNLIPIKMQTIFNEFNFKESRTQFPVKSAFALTIHKSQGMTLDNVVVDIGAKEFCPELTYVALSRIKEFENLKLIPFTAERYLQIKNSLQMKIRIEEYERLKEMSKIITN